MSNVEIMEQERNEPIGVIKRFLYYSGHDQHFLKQILSDGITRNLNYSNEERTSIQEKCPKKCPPACTKDHARML